MAHSSEIKVEVPMERAYSLSLEPTMVEIAIYDIKRAVKPLNVACLTHEIYFGYPLEPASLTPHSIAHTHTGTSQSSGHLHITFSNVLNETQHVTYLKMPPWFIKFDLYTLILTVNNNPHL